MSSWPSEAGLDTGPAIGRGVVPILFRDSYATLAASQFLAARGFYVPPIIQVGVPKDQPRLRFFMSAMHTEADVRNVIAALAEFQAHDSARIAADSDIAAIPESLVRDAMFRNAIAGDAMMQDSQDVLSAAS